MPENISVADCVREGIEFAFELTKNGGYRGDLYGSISKELKRKYYSIDGRTDRIVRSLYWVLTNKLDSPLESIFFVNSASHEYIRKNDGFDKDRVFKTVIDEYLTYIMS